MQVEKTKTKIGAKVFRAMGIGLIAVFLIVFLFPQGAGSKSIPEMEQELNEIQKQIEQQEEILRQKQKETQSLSGQVASFSSEIRRTELSIIATQKDIELTEAEIEKLKTQIKQKEKELAYQKEVLNETIRVIYEETDTNFLEILFSSDNISEVLDRTEYLGAIEGKITDTMAEMNKIKTALAKGQEEQENKKSALENKKEELSSQYSSLAVQRNNYNSLLAATQGEEAKYKAILAQVQREKQNISNEIYQRRLAEAGENVGGGGGTGGYSWSCPTGSTYYADPWGFYKCQCTSYVAWKQNEVYGRAWYRGSGPEGTGHAYNWPNLAPRNHRSVGSNPVVGSIAVWPQAPLMPYGHVAIVEKVHANGTFDVSEYNFTYKQQYGERYNIFIYPGMVFIY